MIKNIIFDLGNVILKDYPYIILNNIEINDKEYEIIKNTFFNNWEELDLGNITIKEYFEKCNIPIKLKKEIKEKLINYYKYREFNLEVLKLMKILKNNNYNIYILSNNNKETYEYLLNLPEFKYVDGWVVSCEYKINKPDKRIYEILLKKYNLNSEECFFIDDKKINIETANLLGIKGHILNYERNGVNELIKDLNKNNIFLEKRDLYNGKRELTGETIYKGEEIPDGKYINVVLIFIENSKGEFLIQKRSKIKNGKFATTGGHPKSGENSIQGLITEVKEELGLDINEKKLQLYFSGRSDEEKVFWDDYYIKMEIPNIEELNLQKEEVESVHWFSIDEIKQLMEEDKFFKNQYEEFEILLNWLDR